jgi:hypothetical protein
VKKIAKFLDITKLEKKKKTPPLWGRAGREGRNNMGVRFFSCPRQPHFGTQAAAYG